MKRHFTLLAALLAIAFAQHSFADDAQTPPTTILAPMSAHPALWTAHGKKGTAYLFGSIHVLPQQVDWRTKEIEAALAKADVFVFELPMDEDLQTHIQNYVQTRGTLPPDKHLRDMLSPRARAIFDREIATLPLPAAEFDHMRPWLADVTIDVLDMQNQHYTSQAGIEEQLKKEVVARAKPVIGLETVDQQLALLVPDDPKIELQNFESDLEHAKEDNDKVGPLLDAWMQGDTRTLARLTAADMKDYPQLRKVLIEDRNKAWVKQDHGAAGREQDLFHRRRRRASRRARRRAGAPAQTGPEGRRALTAKSGRHEIQLHRFRPAGRRLDVLDLAKQLFHAREQLAAGATLKHLSDERRRRASSTSSRDIQRRLEQRNRAQMIGGAVARGRRRHVGEHDIGRAAKRLFQLRRRFGIEQIALQNGRRRRAVRSPECRRRRSCRPRPTRFAATWLQPPGAAPRSSTRAPFFRKRILVIQFDQLERRARAPAFLLGGAHIGIVQLAFQPALRRELARLRVLHPHAHFAAAGLVGRSCGHARAFSINSRSMPSRNPRSATRNCVQGQSVWIAAKIAQPGSTRSARSGPTGPIAARPAWSSPISRSTTCRMSSELCQLASTLART